MPVPAVPAYPRRYMTDEHFWHVYFTLARKYLPEKAFSWTATDVLPSFEPTGEGPALVRAPQQLLTWSRSGSCTFKPSMRVAHTHCCLPLACEPNSKFVSPKCVLPAR